MAQPTEGAITAYEESLIDSSHYLRGSCRFSPGCLLCLSLLLQEIRQLGVGTQQLLHQRNQLCVYMHGFHFLLFFIASKFDRLALAKLACL